MEDGARSRVGMRGRARLWVVALSAVGAVSVASPAAAQSRLGDLLAPRADSARSGSSLLGLLPIETRYLARVAEMARERKRAAAAEEAAAAESYAQRFGVSRDLAERIVRTAMAEGLDPELAFRLVRTESRFVVRAIGPSGSLGLTQLMPSTARSIDRSMDTQAEILDPQNNLRLGFRYLRTLIERYGGDVRLGVLAYNRGEVAVDRALRSGRDPENGYSSRVLGTRSSDPYTGRGLLERD